MYAISISISFTQKPDHFNKISENGQRKKKFGLEAKRRYIEDTHVCK